MSASSSTVMSLNPRALARSSSRRHMLAGTEFRFRHALARTGLIWRSEANATAFGQRLITAVKVSMRRIPIRIVSLCQYKTYPMTAQAANDTICLAMDTPHERLRYARKKSGYQSGADAAEALKIKVSTYRSHENGNRGFDMPEAVRYGAAFKVAPLWLLSGQEPMDASDADKEAVRISRSLTPEERAVWFRFGQALPGGLDRS